MLQSTRLLQSEEETITLGGQLAKFVPHAITIFLHGELGAGKTTLVRGFLRGLGYQGIVKSPTFTLIESYQIARHHVYHFDLYRLHDPGELSYIGIRDYIDCGICFVEWPSQGVGFLPLTDLDCYIDILPSGRQLHMIAHTSSGENLIKQLAENK